jgi:hypothetical protein
MILTDDRAILAPWHAGQIGPLRGDDAGSTQRLGAKVARSASNQLTTKSAPRLR